MPYRIEIQEFEVGGLGATLKGVRVVSAENFAEGENRLRRSGFVMTNNYDSPVRGGVCRVWILFRNGVLQITTLMPPTTDSRLILEGGLNGG